MLKSLKSLIGATLYATDGEIGKIVQFFFDDEKWAVRHLVVETGNWLHGRKVLVSPFSVCGIRWEQNQVNVVLNRRQVEESPDVSTERPISREAEATYNRYYRIPDYWSGDATWGISAYPGVVSESPPLAALEAAPQYTEENPHLHSTRTAFGYRVECTDHRCGRVADFMFDTQTWILRYAVIATRRIWPTTHVLLPIDCVESLDWIGESLRVRVPAQVIAHSPEYNLRELLDRELERRTYGYFHRPAYWETATRGSAALSAKSA